MNEVMKMESFEVNRRGFVSGFAAAAAGAAFGAPLGGDAGADSARPFKVCVFSDIHFDDFWTNSDDTSFLDGIMARAEREKCDMMIHLGDFMHGVEKPRQRMFVERYNASRVPAYHVLGNHDQDQCDAQATLSLWPDGRVRIEGSEADWLFGVTAKAAGYSECDADGRETHPKILSADFRLFV